MNPLAPETPLPNDSDAEIAVLSSCLDPIYGGRFMLVASNALTQEAFYAPDRSKLWGIMQSQHSAGKPMDLAGLLPLVLGAGLPAFLLAEISASGHADPANFSHHLATVLAKNQLRNIFKSAYRTMQAASNPQADPEHVMGDAKAGLDLCEASSSTTVGLDLKELWMRLVDRMSGAEPETAKIATGITKLDNLTRGGPRRGQMVVLGALRHVGKTAFARQIALNAGGAGNSVLCFFAESSDDEEAVNSMAVMSGLPTSAFTGDSRTVDRRTVSGVQRVLRGKIPTVRIETEPNLTVDRIEVQCRLLKATKGLDAVFVDYLQFLSSRPSFKGQTREGMISEDARRLKVMARQLDIVLFLLVQLNDEIGPEDAPEMRHLRESRGPINHADIVLMMSAPDGIAHDPTDPTATQTRLLWNRKWRGVGAFQQAVGLNFKGSTQQFLNDPA